MTETVETLFETVEQIVGIERAAAVFAGEYHDDLDGVEALDKYLISEAQIEITSQIRSGRDPFQAFTNVTDPWPLGIRGRIAAAEYIRGRSNDEYNDETRRFARVNNQLNENNEMTDPQYSQLPLGDFEYDLNPFDDDRLSQEEAEVVLRVRMGGGDEAEIDFDEIGDLDDFVWWFNETQNVEESLRVHPFGQNANSEVLRHALNPDDWSELSPDEIKQGRCSVCQNEWHQIETENGIEWVSEAGDVGFLHDISSPDQEWYGRRSAPEDVEEDRFCSECVDEYFSPATNEQVIVGSDGQISKVEWSYGVRRDLYYAEEYNSEGLTPFHHQIEEIRESSFSFSEGSSADGFLTVHPDQEHGAIDHQQEAISTILDDPTRAAFEGPLIIEKTQRGNAFQIHFPNDRIQAATAAKQIIEEPEVVA